MTGHETVLFRESFRGKRILITGGLGFIGSNLSAALVELGAQVQIVDCLLPNYGGSWRNIDAIKSKVKVALIDVRDTKKLLRYVRGVDFLFNLAGQTSHLDSMTDPMTDLEINCRAQLSILEAWRALSPNGKIVFASTRQLYGKPDYLPVDEKHPLRPVDVNGINKLAGENYHLLYNHVHGVRATVLRLTNTIGPRMRIKDARQTFVGIWVKNVLEGKPIDVWGGPQLRDFTYVDDAVDALLLAAAKKEADGEAFNLGGLEKITLKSLAKLLVELNGEGKYVVKKFPAERKKIDIGHFYADWSKIEKKLGWRPRNSIRDSLAKTLEYYREELKHYS